MKAKKKITKNFDAVKFMRDARDKISKETEGMNFEELKKYFKKEEFLSIEMISHERFEITQKNINTYRGGIL